MLGDAEKYFKEEKQFVGSSTVDFFGPLITGGSGVYGRDISEKYFLDFTGQISLLNTGYSPRQVVSAIHQQVDKLHSCLSADWPYQCKIEIDGQYEEVSRVALAKSLISLTSNVMPFKKRVHFEVSGATGVNLALKIAKIARYEGEEIKALDGFKKILEKSIFIPSEEGACKFSVIAFKGAFHGRHGEAQLLTSSKVKQLFGVSSSCAVGKLAFPTKAIQAELVRTGLSMRNHFLLYAEDMIRQLSVYAPIVAFVFEPVQGENGINIPNREILRTLVDLMRQNNIAIIADEVQTGLGRTGKMFACEHFDIQPDIMVLSKSLGAGLPISAVIVNAEKFKDLDQGMHSGSMHANPLAVAAAIANLNLIQKENLAHQSFIKGEYLLRKLKSLTAEDKRIAEVRGLGLMIGIEFLVSSETRDAILWYCKNNGLLLASAGEKVIRMIPPLIVSNDQIDEACFIFEKALRYA